MATRLDNCLRYEWGKWTTDDIIAVFLSQARLMEDAQSESELLAACQPWWQAWGDYFADRLHSVRVMERLNRAMQSQANTMPAAAPAGPPKPPQKPPRKTKKGR